MESNSHQTLIVGAGLAGCLLALELLNRSEKFLIYENSSSQASHVASGIINPVTGKRLVLSWQFKKLLECALPKYEEINQLFNERLFIQRTIVRLFKSHGEANDFSARSSEPGYREFLGEVYSPSGKSLNDEFGSGEITGAYQLEVGRFIQNCHELFKEKELIHFQTFEHDSLEIIEQGTESFRYKDLGFQRIVFAEGYKVEHNPSFNELPFRPVKGDIMIIRSPELDRETIYKKGILVCPWKEDLHWAGSNYQHEFESETVEKESVNEIGIQIERMLNVPFSMVNQMTGVRPTTIDRRPMMGEHPEIKGMFLFNGMGTKGVSLAPYCCKALLGLMDHGIELEKEMDLKRYWEKSN